MGPGLALPQLDSNVISNAAVACCTYSLTDGWTHTHTHTQAQEFILINPLALSAAIRATTKINM